MAMTDLRELEAAAAEGPWVAHPTAPDGKPYLVTTQSLRVIETEAIDDSALIAALRNALPFLLDVVEAARQFDSFGTRLQRARLRDALDALDAHLADTP